MKPVIKLDKSEIERFRQDLLDWYAMYARDLPWRNAASAYEVWVSEIMLQQTRVDQARPYFERFIERFPDAGALAAADLDDVLLAWEGLGYYSRARNMHRAAREIVETFDGEFPSELSDALSLSGVGSYTAAAVLSIAYGKPEAAIDGNMTRVVARYVALEEPTDRSRGRRTIRSVTESLLERRNPGTFNQAMMDIGATVCTPVAPECGSCPLSENCRARRMDRVDAYPITRQKRPVPHYDIAVGVVSNGAGEILLTRRPEDALLGGLWEFPGARRRADESLHEALRRGVVDRVGLQVDPFEQILAVKHAFSHFKITMYAFECASQDDWEVGETTQPYRWIAPDDMASVALHRAARKIADHIVSTGESPGSNRL